jgi:hypothetical protein
LFQVFIGWVEVEAQYAALTRIGHHRRMTAALFHPALDVFMISGCIGPGHNVLLRKLIAAIIIQLKLAYATRGSPQIV